MRLAIAARWMTLIAALALPGAACKNSDTLTGVKLVSPTPTPTPTPIAGALRLRGYVATRSMPNVYLDGALVAVVDGPQGGRQTLSVGEGRYEIDGLSPGTIHVSATWLSSRVTDTKEITLAADATLDFLLDVDPN